MDDLFQWVLKRQRWQQDALARLAEHGELPTSGLDELQHRIEHANGLRISVPSALRPFRKEHLRRGAAEAPTTILGSIGPVRNVDRLAPGQNPIRFAVNGITLVYGPNGSGKSGYCRIAKNLCRSVHEAPLRGNVLDAVSDNPPEVKLTFKVANESEKREITWLQPDKPPPELARISVFDSHAAGLYVDEDRNLEFLPYQLELLNRLARVIRTLEDRFKTREKDLQTAIKTPLPTGYTEGTAVHGALAKLVPATSIEQLPSEDALRALAMWSEEREKQLNALSDEVRNDPEVLAAARRRIKSTVETLAAECAAVVEALNTAAIDGLKETAKVADIKRATAQASAKDLFEAEPIKDLGVDTWRQMMKYAREFAAQVYADRDPPRIANGVVCVLCQQEMNADARDRLTRFDEYIEGRANKEADVAEAALEQVVKRFSNLTIRKVSDAESLLAELGGLDAKRKTLATAIASLFDGGRKRHATILDAIRGADLRGIGDLEPLPEMSAEMLAGELALLEAEAERFDKLGQEESERTKRHIEYKNLTDQKRLSTEIETIVERRNKLAELKQVSSCKSACSTTGVTQQITKLRREILTPALHENLRRELEAFDLGHLPLKIDDRGEQGTSKVSIGLEAPQRFGRTSEILSDGEQRTLALACFLAELKEIGSTHGIIVDDPVSSLDHGRMEAVARRLVEEASSGRQVIIFTHNITFHYMITSEARQAGVPVRQEWISKQGADVFGIVDDSQKPWQTMKVSQRLKRIERDLAAMKESYDRADEAHRATVRAIYNLIRETWERIIEEILFADVINRFRPEVRTLRLRAAHFDADDYKAVFDGMTRSSHFSGHDHARETPPNLPKLDVIREDFERVKVYAKAATDRNKILEADRTISEKAPPVADIM